MKNIQPLVHILIKMNQINTFSFCFKIHSNMILPSTPRSSNFPLIMLLFTPSVSIPWISHYVLSHLFTLHTCSGVLSALQNKYAIMLKVSINIFSLYVRILSVSCAAANSTPFTLSSAVLCLNVFLIILITSHCPSLRKLCKLLRVLKKHLMTYQSSSICSADGRNF
jgi:hypothetical protein